TNFFTRRLHQIPRRPNRPQNPSSRFDPQTPPGVARNISTANFMASGTNSTPNFSQTVGLQFDALTGPTENGSFPPDWIGAAGPSQFIIFVNGRIRSFSKTTGTVDGVLNVDPGSSDAQGLHGFFSSVMTPLTGGVTLNFTSDPQIRYDRLSKRWFLVVFD